MHFVWIYGLFLLKSRDNMITAVSINTQVSLQVRESSTSCYVKPYWSGNLEASMLL